ncbi:MAG: hypothetical protein ACHQJ5_00425 [Vicinamibacteria bacterium]|jgi:hypothetical protein
MATALAHPATRTEQAIAVDADAETTFDAIGSSDLGSSAPIKALTLARALPDRVIRRLRHLPPQPPPQRTIGGLIDAGWWLVLANEAPHELALGLVMWDPRVAREGQTLSIFEAPADGAVRVVWTLRVEPLGDRGSRLVTETQTNPIGEDARRRFRRYWTLISPFAALTRRLVLRRIARAAEQQAAMVRT